MRLMLAATMLAVGLVGCTAERPPAGDALTARPSTRARASHSDDTGATTETTGASVATLPAKDLGFNRDAAAEAIATGLVRAASCYREGGPSGKGHAVLTFGNDGAVSGVELSEPFDQTDVGACVLAALENVSVDPFRLESGATSLTVGKQFDIGPAQ